MMHRELDPKAARRLIARHGQQIQATSAEEHERLCERYAFVFRPGNRTGSFLGRTLRPLGTAVLIVLSYDEEGEYRRMPLQGFRGAADRSGQVHYGGDPRPVFSYDAARMPRVGARGPVLDPARNPSLVTLGQRMHQVCRKVDAGRLAARPILPRILLSFPADQPPAYEETPALRRAAAQQIEMPVERLGGQPPVLLQRLLRDTWERQLLTAGAEAGTLLVSAEFCTQAGRALRVYEDFSELVGMKTWNPAREVRPLEAPNPSRKILERFAIDERLGFEQFIPPETVAALERALRVELGDVGQLLTEEEVLDALTQPDQPIRAWSPVLPQLRARLQPDIAECTHDDDLLAAARDPAGPLWASGACRVQVLRRFGSDPQEAFRFTADELGRRVTADLWGARPARPATRRQLCLATA